MKLVIVESPSKAKTIQKYLGAGYRVMASGGHVCDLPQKTLGIDIENRFKPEYVVEDARKKELIKRLKKEVKDSEFTYLATDPDREGEAISWHLANTLDLNGLKNRIEFNEITAKAVKQALDAPREINLNLVNAQQARRVLDRLVGYKISPILSRKIKSGLSGGRVQSSALKMIVDREREINAFVPQEYWNMTASLLKDGTRSPIIKGSFQDYNGKKVKLESEEQVKKLEARLNQAIWSVDKVKRGVSQSRPAAPFTTSTLQQDGSQKLGLSSPQIMQLAQQLYEGVDIPGEGHTALVTYIRTDSVRISSEMQAITRKHIQNKYGSAFVPQKPNVYTTKGQNVQDAHEAIRPISLDRTPESLEDKLPKNLYKLYRLIYFRYLASQMTPAVYETLNVRVQATVTPTENYGFKVSGKALTFKGYTAVYEIEKNDDEENELAGNLPNLNEGDALKLKSLKNEQKFTKPSPRYSEATLIKAMEENGIGRPSTYATVISVLTKREYVTKEQKLFKPTSLGEAVTEFMENCFKNIVDIHFTADMESRLDLIEHGSEWQKIIEEFYPSFADDLQKAIYNGRKKVALPEEISDVVCDKCGAKMIIKEGRYGKFLACPNYPECKNIKNFVEPVGKCPICGGDVSKKHGKKSGSIFYGCSNYPKCSFMAWDLPAPILCPECSSVMKVTQEGEVKKYVCTNRKCNHIVVPKE
ncbi:MAG: type I DNA topoisomerase [Clostridia bacterium]|nr:type I DNA topoisomerase [Clostridia bacterium]